MTEDTKTLEPITEPSTDLPSPQGESQPDVQSMLSDISSDLFGPGSKEAVGDGEGVVETTEEEEELSTSKSEEETKVSESPIPSPLQEPPKSWSNEAKAEWAGMSERARQEVLKREEDIFNGIEQYKSRAEWWKKGRFVKNLAV